MPTSSVFAPWVGKSLLCALLAPPAAAADLRVDLGSVARGFTSDRSGRLVTAQLEGRGLTCSVVSREFRFVLADGTELLPEMFEQWELLPLPAELPGRGIAARYTSATSPFAVTVAWFGDGESPWCFKQVRLEASPSGREPPLLQAIDVERLGLLEGTWTDGGLGQPAFCARGLCLALLHPVGSVEVSGAVVTARHFPSSRPEAEPGGRLLWPWSQRAAVGLTLGGSSRGHFLELLEQLRPTSSADGVQVGWSLLFPDASAAAAAPATDVADAAASWAQEIERLAPQIAGKLGRAPSVLCLPEEWLAPAGRFVPRPDRFRNGLARLSEAAAGQALGLGLPLPFVDAAGTAIAFEERAVRREAMLAFVDRLEDARGDSSGKARVLAAVRHRLPPLPAVAEGELAQAGARERRVDGWLDFVRTERKLAPDLHVTYAWPAPAADGAPLSPFWLLAADTLLVPAPMPTPTSDAPAAVPALRRWDRARTEADAAAITAEHGILPPGALRTLGADEAFALPPDGDLRTAADALVLALASGGTELALDVVALAQLADGSALRAAFEWAHARDLVRRVPRRFGGAPERGEIYGFARGERSPELLVVRNPAPRPQTVTLPKATSPWLRTYPWCEALVPDAAGAVVVELLPAEVACFEALATVADLARVPGMGRFVPIVIDERLLDLDLLLPPRSTLSFEWLDAKSGEVTGRSGAGVAGAFGLREARAPFEPELSSALLDERGDLSFEWTTASRCHRRETLAFDLIVEGVAATALEPTVVADGPHAATLARGPGWLLWRATCEEFSRPVNFQWKLAGALGDGNDALRRVTLLARRDESLTAARVAAAPAATPRKPPALPPQEFAATRTTVTTMQDGPLARPAKAATPR